MATTTPLVGESRNPLIRSVTALEMETSGVARGWESQTEDMDFWFDEIEEGVEGVLPGLLSGTFIRNGPGIIDVFGEPLKHPIDGDGLVCALSINNGRAHFRSRFVATATHEAEQKTGTMLFPGQVG